MMKEQLEKHLPKYFLLKDTKLMKLLMEKRAMYGRLFDGVRHDVGNKLDFIKTNIVLGLQREDIGAELREWLKGLG